jgi:hypothetical protein
MAQGKRRHLFPGGNTSLGFFSYYHQIIAQEEAERVYVIKGGPGVGKSTFMKRIAEEMLSRGYDVEYLHCSSDPGSLDGVLIPQLKVAFIDGTAPHVIDPKTPGAVDEILNFGAYWDGAGIRAHKDAILKTSREIQYLFARAYRYLGAAHAICEGSAAVYADALDRGRANALAADLIEAFFADVPVGKAGRERRMFASAITPDGFVHYLDTVLTAGRVYEFRGQLGSGEDGILEKVKNAAIERGYDVEGYYCALNPHKLEHLVIPGLDAALTTANRYHRSGVKAHASADMLEYMDRGRVERYRDDLAENEAQADGLLAIALKTLRRAKSLHDELEGYYIPHIRFQEIDRCLEAVLARIVP